MKKDYGLFLCPITEGLELGPPLNPAELDADFPQGGGVNGSLI